MTRFELYKSLSEDELVTRLAGDPLCTICELVCNDDCEAISDLNGSAEKKCRQKIKAWLEQEMIPLYA